MVEEGFFDPRHGATEVALTQTIRAARMPLRAAARKNIDPGCSGRWPLGMCGKHPVDSTCRNHVNADSDVRRAGTFEVIFTVPNGSRWGL